MHHVMTPIELSKMKSDQERQLQTALLEQRQAAVLAFQGHRVNFFFFFLDFIIYRPIFRNFIVLATADGHETSG